MGVKWTVTSGGGMITVFCLRRTPCNLLKIGRLQHQVLFGGET